MQNLWPNLQLQKYDGLRKRNEIRFLYGLILSDKSNRNFDYMANNGTARNK